MAARGLSRSTEQRVVILGTGGTIAMRNDAASGGAVPTIGARGLVDALPPGLPAVRPEEIVRLPSSHFHIDTLWAIRDRVGELVDDPLVGGVVVTHGTDTLEETAFLLDIAVPRGKPIVLTGAMRTTSALGYDGRVNLVAAVQVAGTAQAGTLGVVVVFNDEIHAARYVTKMHTVNTDAFQSPGWGPVGRVERGVVAIQCGLEPHSLPWCGLEPNVPLLKLGVAMDAAPMAMALSHGARGIVIEALGGGRVPPWWLDPIEQARARGLPVVIASRCPSGPIGDDYGYRGAYRTLADMGCLFADYLNGPKARVKLMVVLAAAATTDEVANLWAT